jgi:hypothetical protein
MKSRGSASSATLVLVCVVVLITAAQAQYRGTLQGTVTDAQGAVVPGAKVTLTDKETNRTLSATTNDSGVYNVYASAQSLFHDRRRLVSRKSLGRPESYF